jgi:hypothetical protein
VIRKYLKHRRTKKQMRMLLDLDTVAVSKWFLLDSRIVEAQQLGTLLGLSEITETELIEAHRRAVQTNHLAPLVSYFATLLTDSVMEYYETISPYKNVLSPDERAAMEQWIAKVAASCTMGCISTFDRLELLEVK